MGFGEFADISAILSNFVPIIPPFLSTDNVSSERLLLRNSLPSIGITQHQQYYGIIRLPAFHLRSFLLRQILILF